MKKTIALMLAVCLLVCVCGCGKKAEEETVITEEKIEEVQKMNYNPYATGMYYSDSRFNGSSILNRNILEFVNFANLTDNQTAEEVKDASGNKLLKVSPAAKNVEILPGEWFENGVSYTLTLLYKCGGEFTYTLNGTEYTGVSSNDYTEIKTVITADTSTYMFTVVKPKDDLYLSKIMVSPVFTDTVKYENGEATVSGKCVADVTEFGIVSVLGNTDKLTLDTENAEIRKADGKTVSEKYSVDDEISLRLYARLSDGNVAYGEIRLYSKRLLENAEKFKTEESTFNMADIYEKTVINSRYSVIGKAVTFDWTAQSIKFTAECSGNVKMKLRFDKKASVGFVVLIDGKRDLSKYTVSGEAGQACELVFNVGDVYKKREIEVVRVHERNNTSIDAETLTLHGELLNTDKKGLFIEFLGDSVTCGGAGYRYYPEGGGEAQYGADGTIAYSYITARALNADYRMVSNSGYGFKYASDGAMGVGHTWDKEYGIENYCRNTETAYDSKREADVVCIFMGTNDVNAKYIKAVDFTTDDLADGIKENIDYAKKYNPNAKVVVMVGGMTSGYGEAAAIAANSCGGIDNGVYVFNFSSDDFHKGGYWHPSVNDHKQMAKELTDFLTQNVLS